MRAAGASLDPAEIDVPTVLARKIPAKTTADRPDPLADRRMIFMATPFAKAKNISRLIVSNSARDVSCG
jgi:hypothetical protein